MNDTIRVCILIIASPGIAICVVTFGIVFPLAMILLFLIVLLVGLFKNEKA